MSDQNAFDHWVLPAGTLIIQQIDNHSKFYISMILTRFADVITLASTRTADPLAAGIERFVGLEHIEPENLHIRSWGLVADGTTFTNTFQRGQVLFGKRRAYQRKVAIAEFDGVCSSDIYVFESKDPTVLLPELLPFILQSEGFYEYAVKTSAGSLSPRTNWTHLANYEFPLPPVDEQRRIADLLWAADDVISQHQDLLEKAYSLKKSAIHEYTRKSKITRTLKSTEFGDLPENWGVEPLGNLLTNVQYGLSKPLFETGKYPVFRMMNIIDGKMATNDMKYIDLPDDELKVYRVDKGDILFNRTNSADLVGKLGIFELDGDYVFASYLIRLVVKRDVILPEYLNYYLNSEEGQNRISAFATAGVSQTNINASNLQRVLVPVPPIEEQKEVVAELSQIDSAKQEIIGHIENSQELKKQLLAKFLSQD
jgi:type I restriction enzyme S subunit